ncbi:MAG: hypothetical protein GY908_13205, partial [Flavobacteriales bacterium]|nr:hypothetical protein [Flavobacteriales bacterium]
MKKLSKTILIMLLFMSVMVSAQNQIIPAPRSYEATQGELVIEGSLDIILMS